MNFSERLIGRLRATGLSSQALASKVGVSPSAVSKWLTTDAMPRMSLMPAIAEALGTTMSEFFEEEE